MDITDYIPNIFGAAAPTSYESLQTMGLISPQQLAQQQKTANIQGLLGAGLALAQGMSRIGPRRSAAENILGALAGGFGAAGGAYQQGLQNVVQQQQLQSAALTQAQATNRLRAIQQASQQNPQLAQLFAINPEEASKQLLAIERAKMYGFGTEPAQDMSQIPAQMPAQASPQPELPSSLAVTSKGTQFVGVPNFAAGERYVDANLNQQAQQTLQPRPAQAVPMVDQASVAKANENRRKAALALSLGDKETAGFFEREAERLDPKETLFFRDGRLISSKRGELANYGGGRILTDAEATSLGLDTSRGKWTMKDNIPSLVQGTSKTNILSKEEAQAIGLDVNNNKTYQRKPDGTIDYIQGSEIQKTTQLSDAQAKDIGLDISRGQKYQQKTTGDIDVIQGTMQDAPKYTGMYANVALEEFQTADVTKLTPDQRKKVGQIAEARTGTAAEKGASKVIVSPAEKKFGEEFGRGVAGAVETTYNKAASAQQTISTINNIRPLIKDGVYSGPLSTSNMYIDRLASSLGITSGSINDKLVRTSQAMQGLASLELSAAEAMKGQGAITENERSLIARAAGGNFAQFTAAEVSGLLNALEKTAKSKISAHTKNLERLRKRKDTADLADFYELQSTDNLQDAARQELERRKGK
jgi:hypothetical protein